jgi:hypothetical protein
MNDFQELVMEFAEEMHKQYGFDPDEILFDFNLYNLAIDRLIDKGMAEEDAVAYVSSNWEFPTVD